MTKTTLNIIPIELHDVDFDNKTIGSVTRGPIDMISTDINLELGRGKYFNNLNNILPIKLPKFKIGSEFVGTSADTMM